MSQLKEVKVKKNKSELEEKWDKAIPVYYGKFHSPVPPAANKEPVYEFYIKGPTGKYLVDDLRWSWGDGLLFKAYGTLDMTPAANVQVVRFTP